jgi:hypothetical protein
LDHQPRGEATCSRRWPMTMTSANGRGREKQYRRIRGGGDNRAACSSSCRLKGGSISSQWRMIAGLFGYVFK